MFQNRHGVCTKDFTCFSLKKEQTCRMTSFVFVNFCCSLFCILSLMVMVNVLGILGTMKAGGLPCRGAETVHLSALRCSVGTRVLLQYITSRKSSDLCYHMLSFNWIDRIFLCRCFVLRRSMVSCHPYFISFVPTFWLIVPASWIVTSGTNVQWLVPAFWVKWNMYNTCWICV